MGFVSLATGGLGFILIGFSEALSFPSPKSPNPNPNQIQSSPTPNPNRSSSPTLSLVLASLLSSLVVLDSVFSFSDAVSSRDRVGSVLQLQTAAAASLFLLHAVAGILLPLPSPVVDSIGLFAFAEEFLLFYLQRKDASGIENRYFDLILVPIAVCAVSAALGLRSPESAVPRLGRAAGLVLQGTWLVQMAVSFHTGMVAHGCSLHARSRGNYTIKCKGHGEYHRARAIATLQFNCHLALIVAVASAMYSIISRRFAGELDFRATYRPIAAEMQAFEGQTRFTLDSDEEENDNVAADERKGGSTELGMNGHHVSDL